MKRELFHFTCDHGHDGMGAAGLLLPYNFQMGIRVAWMTTQREPDREKTGLGMHYTRCDRMKYCYEVLDRVTPRWWITSPERAATNLQFLADLETYGDPENWWITSEPVKVRLLVAAPKESE